MFRLSYGISSARRLWPAVCLLLSVVLVPHVCAQTNYTVGDNNGSDCSEFIYAPFFWMYDMAESEYIKHVRHDSSNPPYQTGQGYWLGVEYIEYSDPSWPWVAQSCNVPHFHEIISSYGQDLGTLLITTHGNPDGFAVEVYDSSASGRNARNQAYDYYTGTLGYSNLYKGIWSGPVFVDTLLIRLGHNLRLELGRTNVPEC